MILEVGLPNMIWDKMYSVPMPLLTLHNSLELASELYAPV